MVKEHVQKLIDKYAPETGLLIDKESEELQDFLNDEFCVTYHIKGDMKYIRFILCNIHNDVAKLFLEEDKPFSIQQVLAEDENNQKNVVTIITQDDKFCSLNQCVSPADYPIFSLKLAKDNHLELNISMQKNIIDYYDLEMIKIFDDYFENLFEFIDERILEQANLINSIKNPLFLTTNPEIFFEEDKKETKPKKRRKSNGKSK